jgi:hypothetical protein
MAVVDPNKPTQFVVLDRAGRVRVRGKVKPPSAGKKLSELRWKGGQK